MPSYRFPKREKLSRRKLWESVFQQGKRLRAFPLSLYYLKTPLPEDVPVQAGFAVPRKTFRRAVDRNRIKRLMREAYRLEREGTFNNMQGSYAFVFLYLGKEKVDYAEVAKAMRTILNTFKTHEKPAEN